jgi:asparagine synthase (glutamine-hydrolysing)
MIRHRGPDGFGSFVDDASCVVLGHRRLAILDLSDEAAQPMQSELGALVYNGEIYNFRDLRREIEGCRRFRSTSDTEALLALLERDGSASLGRLSGMFAGAYFDKRSRSVTLFRDALGIKPLYMARLPDSTIVFGSEIKGIFALVPTLVRRASVEALACYLRYENFPQGESLFEGIRLLRPGEVVDLRLDADGAVVAASHAMDGGMAAPAVEEVSDWEEARRLVLEALERTVSSHLISDVPLGAYLSGGIDSSIVTSLAARNAARIMAFTGYFGDIDPFYDERPLARSVAQAAGIDHVEVAITPAHFERSFDRMIWALEEPRMGMGSFSQFVVAEAAAKERKVILAGHGGDELFGGYPTFKAGWVLDTWRESPRRALACAKTFRAKEWPWLVYQARNVILQREAIYAPEIFAGSSPIALRAPELERCFRSERPSSLLGGLFDYYCSTYLPGLLMVEDKISMAHSLETRVPLWNREFIAAVRRFPASMLLRGGSTKALLKSAATSVVPPELLQAPKRGFPTPLRVWFRGPLRSFVHDRLIGSNGFVQQLIPRRRIERLLASSEHLPLPFALDERRAHQIWMLLSLESWASQYQVSLGGSA